MNREVWRVDALSLVLVARYHMYHSSAYFSLHFTAARMQALPASIWIVDQPLLGPLPNWSALASLTKLRISSASGLVGERGGGLQWCPRRDQLGGKTGFY